MNSPLAIRYPPCRLRGALDWRGEEQRTRTSYTDIGSFPFRSTPRPLECPPGAVQARAMARDENDAQHNGATPSARPPRKLPASFASGPPKPKVRKLPRFGGEDSATHAMPDLVLQQPAICSWHAEEVDLHCDGLLRRHVEGTLGPLGFDVEWPVTFRQGQAPLPVATVQLAADGDVFVFQVSPARGGLPPRLRALLEEPTLPKVRAPTNGTTPRR